MRRYVARLRLVSKGATIRLEFDLGDVDQVDFGLAPKLIDSATGELRSPWIFGLTGRVQRVCNESQAFDIW